MTYLQQLHTLREDALADILKLTTALVTFTEDTEADEFYELPVVSEVSKHGYYEERAIVAVSWNGVKTIGKSEGVQGEIEHYEFAEVDNVNLFALADLLISKAN